MHGDLLHESSHPGVVSLQPVARPSASFLSQHRLHNFFWADENTSYGVLYHFRCHALAVHLHGLQKLVINAAVKHLPN
jgi:hypothetical protein